MPVLKQPKAAQNDILKNISAVIEDDRSESGEYIEFGLSHLTYTDGVKPWSVA